MTLTQEYVARRDFDLYANIATMPSEVIDKESTSGTDLKQ